MPIYIRLLSKFELSNVHKKFLYEKKKTNKPPPSWECLETGTVWFCSRMIGFIQPAYDVSIVHVYKTLPQIVPTFIFDLNFFPKSTTIPALTSAANFIMRRKKSIQFMSFVFVNKLCTSLFQ